MKKITSIILGVLILLSSVSFSGFTAVAEELNSELDVLEYEILQDNTIKITRYDSMDLSFAIPAEIEGKKVTVIGKKAFAECHSLTSVTIPDTVTVIEDRAFEKCDKLNSVTLGASVITLGYRAFAENKVLKNINLPDSLITIGRNCFIRCFKLQSISIPDSVTQIGDSAFSDCTDLKTVDFGNGFTVIGESAFGWCLNLTEVSVSKNTTEIKNNAFVACDKIQAFTIQSKDCVIYDGVNTLPENAVIRAIGKSTAHQYAEKYSRKFEIIEKEFEKLLGDTDLDTHLTILDATAIQLHLAELSELSSESLINADIDEDTIVSVLDATRIQMILAELI